MRLLKISMKRLLLPLLAALALPTAVEANWLLLGRYGSFYEAKEACEEWVLKGGTYQVEYKNGLLPYRVGTDKVRDIRTRNLRECFDDTRTNQVLGLTQKRAKEGGSYDAEYLYEGNANKSRKVIKKFKY